jgi:hypothetical protein
MVMSSESQSLEGSCLVVLGGTDRVRECLEFAAQGERGELLERVGAEKFVCAGATGTASRGGMR